MTLPSSVRYGVIALVLVLLGQGLWASFRSPALQLQGEIEGRELHVGGKVPGRIAALEVRLGDKVQAGHLLYRLESPELQAKLTQATATKEAASAVARKADKGAREEEIRAARLNWERAEAGANLAQVTYQRVKNLYAEGVISEQRHDEARANWTAARDLARAAKAQYDMARNGARPEDREAASAQAKAAGGVVQEVNSYLSELEVRAPEAGEITGILAEPGEIVPAGFPVVSVLDTSSRWLVLQLPETLLNHYQTGARFQAHIPALGKSQEFTVYYVAAMADFATQRARKSGRDYDIRLFEVRARPADSTGLRPGMTVLVDQGH
ncbi:MAG: HlyD family efflux transporter periplasmic adaptor subunit [Pedobacter sp.]|nr:HlyD family efflux transporter periplasmic adaptor subunit [Pedobacter sp.]